mmetsp:Transcript_2704/g.9083  ORF Transcript_2704/g.9083 Transcript_2704/m.9083 type:complete len:96 (-) Transcript_2704:1110-1397(-)
MCAPSRITAFNHFCQSKISITASTAYNVMQHFNVGGEKAMTFAEFAQRDRILLLDLGKENEFACLLGLRCLFTVKTKLPAAIVNSTMIEQSIVSC